MLEKFADFFIRRTERVLTLQGEALTDADERALLCGNVNKSGTVEAVTFISFEMKVIFILPAIRTPSSQRLFLYCSLIELQSMRILPKSYILAAAF
ncbi:MAG TPA: hypothetical protein DDX91_02875 [Ruminococcaceae bacterium]|nr:hypothetical protein [Oscillospiraceae bacterium]